jgi:predicted deacylase
MATAEAAPGFVAGDGAHALAKGTVALGAVSVGTGAETVAPTAGAGADESEGTMALVKVTFAIDPGQVAGTFTVTQIAGPTLTFTVLRLDAGFAIIPTAQPAANTVYTFGYHT